MACPSLAAWTRVAVALDHANRLLVFAIKENAQTFADRLRERDVAAEVRPVSAEQLDGWRELTLTGEEATFEHETGYREDAGHAAYAAEEFLRRVD